MPFYSNSFQFLCLWLHPYRVKFCAVALLANGLVTDERNPGKNWLRLARDDKIAAFVGHTACNQCRILGREQGDVGIGYGLALLVNDGALVSVVCFLHAFHENLLTALVIACRDTDGIESYHLSDGFGQCLAVDGRGDAEVLQFVVEKHDGIAGLLLAELPEGIGERNIVIGMCDALGMHNDDNAC